MQMNNTQRIRFDEFSFCLNTLELRHSDKHIKLQPQPSELLAYLITNSNRIIPRDELQEHLWPGSYGEFDQNLNYCINKIRSALKDTPKSPKYLETVPKRGYRFLRKMDEITITYVKEERKKGKSGEKLFKTSVAIGSAMSLIISAAVAVWEYSSPNMPKQTNSALVSFQRAEYLRKQANFESAQRSLAIYEKALSLDPDLGAAHAGIAYSLYGIGGEIRLIKNHIAKALEIEPNNEVALLVKLALTLRKEWDIKSAHQIAEQILNNNPTHIRALHYLSLTATLYGDTERAKNAIELSLRADPAATQIHSHAGWLFYLAGNLGAALEHCEASVELEPDLIEGHQCSIYAANAIGLEDRVKHHITELLRIKKANSETTDRIEALSTKQALQNYYFWDLYRLAGEEKPDSFELALAYARIKDYSNAIEQLKVAKEERHFIFPIALIFPEFKPIKNTPRFSTLFKELTM